MDGENRLVIVSAFRLGDEEKSSENQDGSRTCLDCRPGEEKRMQKVSMRAVALVVVLQTLSAMQRLMFSFFRAGTLLSFFGALALGTSAGAADVTFRTDVMSVLSKAGCNAGACHGNGNGKGGFRLSLRGQDPDLDWLALARDQGGRRVNLIEPDKSLILLKATAALAHEGGQRFAPGSPEHEIVLRWLRDGARESGGTGPKLVALRVTPPEKVVVTPENRVKLTAVARFPMATSEISRDSPCMNRTISRRKFPGTAS
jgi:hypothetical protein